jgi:hypothetical protein
MKRITALLIVLMFAVTGTVFAGGVRPLRDSDLDNVNAGDWIVVPEGSEVMDVYSTNNTLDLEDEAQMEVQALSNANIVDSAAVVQANVANVDKGEEASTNVAVAGLNQATIMNYRPGSMLKTSEKTTMAASKSTETAVALSEEAACTLNFSKACAMQAGSAAAASRNYNYDETLDIVGALAIAGETESKNGDSEMAIAASLLVDYDKDIVEVNSASASSYAGANGSENMTLVKTSKASATLTDKLSEGMTCSKETSNETRTTLGENNHIKLEDTAQTNIMAVSNLNAVGAGVAVQTNVANNVGVNGSISGTNIANVSSGL